MLKRNNPGREAYDAWMALTADEATCELAIYPCFHGTTPGRTKNILEHGPDPTKCETSVYGKGFYGAINPLGMHSFLYTKSSDDNTTTQGADDDRTEAALRTYRIVVFLAALPENIMCIPVVTDGQTVFGVHGVLRDETDAVICFGAEGIHLLLCVGVIYLRFEYEVPSDTAFLHVQFPKQVWIE